MKAVTERPGVTLYDDVT